MCKVSIKVWLPKINNRAFVHNLHISTWFILPFYKNKYSIILSAYQIQFHEGDFFIAFPWMIIILDAWLYFFIFLANYYIHYALCVCVYWHIWAGCATLNKMNLVSPSPWTRAWVCMLKVIFFWQHASFFWIYPF